VFVADENTEASTMNEMLSKGYHLVLQPGNYNLTDSIYIEHDNTVVLGFGFPTIIPTTGKPVVSVKSGVNGARIAGIFYEAGPTETDTLLLVGEDSPMGHVPADPNNPIVLSDVFLRVGGPNNQDVQQVYADKMVVINQDNVVVDNTWLWRADHSVSGLVYNGDNPCTTGAVINGDNVIVYALAVEHTLQDMTVWNGNNGQVFFYQSEFPYDVNTSYATSGYVSYRVHPQVHSHHAYGVGAYSYFRDYPVFVNSGFEYDGPSKDVTFKQAISVFLNGMGGINHVINDRGLNATGDFVVVPVCTFP